MYNNAQILELFEQSLRQLRTPEEPELLYAPIIYSMSGGGKRLRPVLLLLSTEAFGGSVDEAMTAAMGITRSEVRLPLVEGTENLAADIKSAIARYELK